MCEGLKGWLDSLRFLFFNTISLSLSLHHWAKQAKQKEAKSSVLGMSHSSCWYWLMMKKANLSHFMHWFRAQKTKIFHMSPFVETLEVLQRSGSAHRQTLYQTVQLPYHSYSCFIDFSKNSVVKHQERNWIAPQLHSTIPTPPPLTLLFLLICPGAQSNAHIAFVLRKGY